MKWLSSFLGSRRPWDDSAIRRRLRPLTFRLAQESDFPFCESLHVANEPHGVPSNHRGHYSEALRNGKILTMIAEDDGVPVATCAINRAHDRLAWLCYGLVIPSRHRTGIGTTMFVARLSLLDSNGPDQAVAISALETSLSYYRQFGFRLVGRFDSEDGNRYPIAVLENISGALIEDCRDYLREAKTVVPDVAEKIPYDVSKIAAGYHPA